MSDDARRLLAEGQAKLVAALTGQGEIPQGFDASRVSLAAATLIQKRARAVCRTWPRLCEALGKSFDGEFRDFAGVTPLPSEGAGSDGAAFARYLNQSRKLPEDGKLEWFYFRLRRGVLAVAWLSEARRLVIGVRIPFFGVRICSVKLWISRTAQP